MKKDKPKIYEQGLESYPLSTVVSGNFFLLGEFILGTIACWFLHPLFACFYLASAIIIVYIVLKKLVCTNCYYYSKWCCLGWGKLCALLFKKGNIEKFSRSIGVKIAAPIYIALTLIPLIAITISIFINFTVFKLSIMIAILIIGIYSGVISRKKTCAVCKMRLICPGSATK